MIITRTPLRISLVGGGTDMPSFYTRHGGAVISMAIDKYIYISLNKKFDGRIRVSYSQTENVDTAEELKHDLVRYCLTATRMSGVEITSVSDIPGEGSGLGSSSSFMVGLLKAIFYENVRDSRIITTQLLADLAYIAESGAGHIIGKQDHFAAAYGGMNLFSFETNGAVQVESLLTKEKRAELEKRLLLFWTGRTRNAASILAQQSENISGPAEHIAMEMFNLARSLATGLRLGTIKRMGEFLDRNWQLKKTLAPGISEPWIDDLYRRATQAGASGGKICGAGGGGFFLFYADPEYHPAIEKAVGLRRVPFHIEEEGSKIIYGSD